MAAHSRKVHCGIDATATCCLAICRVTTCAAGKDGVTTFRKPCNKSNGLAWDNEGRLIACEHASSCLTRTEADGSITVLASHHGDKELNSPNDVVVKRDGAIYFSDPSYGGAGSISAYPDRSSSTFVASTAWLPTARR